MLHQTRMSTLPHLESSVRPLISRQDQLRVRRSRRRCAIRVDAADDGSGGAAAHAAVCMFEQALGHAKQGHPECPERIASIQHALNEAGILLTQPSTRADKGRAFEVLDAASAAQRWRGAPAAEALARMHPPGYLARLERACASLSGPTLVDESTYLAPGSYAAGLDAVAAALACLDAALARRRPAFCFCRPPGHHAAARPMGFGAANAVAAAAGAALAAPGVAKVAIFDFDVHHGNGTEDLLCRDGNPNVMYVSMHQAGLWPYTGKLTSNSSGGGNGGSGPVIINVPLPGGAGDAAARAVWDRVVAPAAAAFAPDVLLVSAGFDAHYRDPLAALQLASSTYHWLGAACAALAAQHCQGRCLFVLEGGYDLRSLGEAAAEASRGLLGLPAATPPASDLEAARLLQPEPMQKVHAAIDDVLRRHRSWLC